ncbi:MAG TPA: hypothetical protein VNA14_11880 [Mycobacteriales bacterium]|nr:hypothetical protein [Mycobacteriales bacterium]
MQNDTSPGREVRLADVPVGLYRAAQQHTDAVLRELVLMAGYEAADRADGPMRQLFTRASAGYADRLELSSRAAPDVDAAHARGDEHVTIVYRLPDRIAESTEAWGRLLDDLDALCREGTMLSVPATPEVGAFARWWCNEFVRQLRDGAEPTPWPSFVAQSESLRG